MATYEAQTRVIFNNGEGADGYDLNDAQVFRQSAFQDFFIQPSLNLFPDNSFIYPYLQENGGIFSEGIQPLARPSAIANTVTNGAGTIYWNVDGYNAQTPNSATPKIYAIELAANALQVNSAELTPDVTNPRWAIIYLNLTTGTDNASRRFKDNTTRAVTTQSVPKYQKVIITTNVVLGTPAANPVFPSGYTGVAQGPIWALVYIPANHSTVFTTEQVIPAITPRVSTSIPVYPATNGIVTTGGLSTPKTEWLLGPGFQVFNGTWAMNGNASSWLNSNTPARLQGSMPLNGSTSGATVTQVTAHVTPGGASAGTLTWLKVPAMSGTGAVGPEATVGTATTSGTSAQTITINASAVINDDIVTYFKYDAGQNGDRFFGCKVTYQTNGFSYDGYGTVTAVGPGPFQMLIPFPDISSNKKIIGITVDALTTTNRFSIKTFFNNLVVTTLFSPAQMNEINSGGINNSTFSFYLNQKVATVQNGAVDGWPNWSLWCHGKYSPFTVPDFTLKPCLVWTPSAGETMGKVIFRIAG